MTRRTELERLNKGPLLNEKPEGIGLVRFIAHCPDNAPIVLARIKEVMSVVIRSDNHWPSDDEWRSLLPLWFVASCAPERSKEEAEEWLNWWRSLPPEEQTRVESEEAWSVANWVYWFQLGQRLWYWWDASVEDATTLRIEIEADSWPFPSGALEWLIKAAGATGIEQKT